MPKIADQESEAVIYEEMKSEVETEPLSYEVNLHGIDIERKVVVETVNE